MLPYLARCPIEPTPAKDLVVGWYCSDLPPVTPDLDLQTLNVPLWLVYYGCCWLFIEHPTCLYLFNPVVQLLHWFTHTVLRYTFDLWDVLPTRCLVQFTFGLHVHVFCCCTLDLLCYSCIWCITVARPTLYVNVQLLTPFVTLVPFGLDWPRRCTPLPGYGTRVGCARTLRGVYPPPPYPTPLPR